MKSGTTHLLSHNKGMLSLNMNLKCRGHFCAAHKTHGAALQHRATSSRGCPICRGHWCRWTKPKVNKCQPNFSFLLHFPECSIQNTGRRREGGGADYVSNKNKCSCSQTSLQLPFVIFSEPRYRLSLLGATECQLRGVQGQEHTGHTTKIQKSWVWEARTSHPHHSLGISWASFN